jgi:glycine/D-amino acid oxidase-like deaminating enzyme
MDQRIMDDLADVAVIGGGFYGCVLAGHARQFAQRVVLLEKQDDLLQRASFNNQARVHNGYHYPRSLLTALRSHANFARFLRDYRGAIDDRFDKYYAVAAQFSKVSARQFETFCRRIGVPVEPAPAAVRKMFDPRRIEAVFRVEECAFDAVKLKADLRDMLAGRRVQVLLGCKVTRLRPVAGGRIVISFEGPGGPGDLTAGLVLHCTYSQLNQVLAASDLGTVPLKHELTEIALVEVPEALRTLGITVMCGPFFSCMPFPARAVHSLSHVRYTPHQAWEDRAEPACDVHAYLDSAPRRSQFEHMRKDAARYVPLLADCRQTDSLWEIKTVLPASEQDDSRPILFRQHPDLPNLHCVLGSKIDNVYDALAQLDALFLRREAA